MPSHEDINVISRRRLANGHLQVEELTLDAPRFSGGRIKIDREIVLRQDAAAALVHDVERDIFVFAEQLRVPCYEAGTPWLLELVAGKIDPGETPEQCILREIGEEIGYRAGPLEPICLFFAAPGYSTERLHLYYAPVNTRDLIHPDAHGKDEGEDIRRVELPRAEFLDRLDKRDFLDVKTLALSGWAIKRFG
jgi:ADP-ribose pyrophosphatase